MENKSNEQNNFFYLKNTQDKNPEMALFFNIALDRINKLISLYENKTSDIVKLNWNDDSTIHFKNTTYLHLQIYFWKEHSSLKFNTINISRIKIINLFLKKLIELRNFHSHYYHSSQGCKFPIDLIHFMNSQFDCAKNILFEKHKNFQKYIAQLENDETEFVDNSGLKRTDVYKHFEFFTTTDFITAEGKNFFLSFFLLKSEMTKFLKKRNRCKRDNGEKYQVKHKLLTFYCHRDNSTRFFLQGKADYYDENELLRRQFNTIINYLKSKPVADIKYMPPTKEITLNSKEEVMKIKEAIKNGNIDTDSEKEIIRRKDKFMEIAIRYFMDRKNLKNEDSVEIYWHVKKIELIEKISNEETQKKYYKHDFAWSSEFNMNEFPVIMNKHIKFKIGKEGTEYAIGESEIKNWLYYLLNKENPKTLKDTIEAIESYGNQYKEAMKELVNDENITFSKYPKVFNKGIKSEVLSEMHEKILNKTKFDLDNFRSIIETKLKSEINLLNFHLNNAKYSRNQKNRIIIECFDWYLTNDNKLNPSDINILSKYNYVAENNITNAQYRESIIKDIKFKLEKAKDDAFDLLVKASNLDTLFIDMINKKIKSLEMEKEQISNKNLDMLKLLAGKLGVSMPGIDVSRDEKIRIDELKKTILKKPILLSNGLFKRAFDADDKTNISAYINIKRNWQELLIDSHYKLSNQNEFINKGTEAIKDISKEVLELVENNYDNAYNEFKKSKGLKFKELVKIFSKYSTDKSPSTEKQIAKAINLNKSLREIKNYDALLAQIVFEYHNPTLTLKEREAKQKNIATLHEEEYKLQIGNKFISLKYKQLDDLATQWDRKKINKLINNTNYWSEEILEALDAKSKISDQQKILIIMNKVFEDSYYYIDAFLKTEKKVIDKQDDTSLKQMISDSRIERNFGLERIEPKVVLKKIPITDGKLIEKFVDFRNDAFHTDIPQNNQKYETIKDELMEKAGIPKEDKRGKIKEKYNKKMRAKSNVTPTKSNRYK